MFYNYCSAGNITSAKYQDTLNSEDTQATTYYHIDIQYKYKKSNTDDTSAVHTRWSLVLRGELAVKV